MVRGYLTVAIAAAFVFPAPTGSFSVGTTSWRLLDATRRESFEGDVVARQVEVLAWYPAARGRWTLAPYLREGDAEVQGFAAS